jgi:hypothetical protein
MRHVCPQSTMAYRVRVTDTGASGELARAPETASAPVTADVIDCSADGGVPCASGSGHYAGQFVCSLNGALPFMGSLDVTLAEQASGASLGVTGLLDGLAYATTPSAYSPIGPALVNGTWHLETTPAILTCDGTWNAKLESGPGLASAVDAGSD